MITFRKPYRIDDIPKTESEIRVENLKEIKTALEECIDALRDIAGEDAGQYADDVHGLLADVEDEIRMEQQDEDTFRNNNRFTAPVSGNSVAGW